jgi:hypothetical protein
MFPVVGHSRDDVPWWYWRERGVLACKQIAVARPVKALQLARLPLQLFGLENVFVRQTDDILGHELAPTVSVTTNAI